MNCKESIKWLEGLIRLLGQSEYQSLWNWKQPLTEVKEMLENGTVLELPCKIGNMEIKVEDGEPVIGRYLYDEI